MYATFMSTIWNHMACAPSRNFAGSISDGVIGIFHWYNPSGRTMTLGLTQPLIEMSVRNICWVVQAAVAKGWQPYHIHVPTAIKSRSLSHLVHTGPVQDCNGTSYRENIYFIFTYLFRQIIHCSFSVQSAYIPSCWSHIINPFPLPKAIPLTVTLTRPQLRLSNN
jgi:hypothetical protein